MKWKPIIFAVPGIIIVVLLLLPWIDMYWPRTQNDVISDVFKDPEVFSVIQNPESVTAQRLHRKTFPALLLSDYDQDAPVTLTANEVQTLKRLLESPWSYDWGVRTCGPDYGAVFRFRSHGHTVRVAVCYKCEEVGVFDGDNDGSRQINNTLVFKPMNSQLVAIAKEIFPNDKEIQGLK
jgi:hypothetical protein